MITKVNHYKVALHKHIYHCSLMVVSLAAED